MSKVPAGWCVKMLAEITKEKISYGIVQAGPHVKNGIPYIKSSDVGAEISPSSLQRTSEEIHYKYRRSSVYPGDLIFSLRGNIGSLSIVPNQLPLANLTQGTARISVKSDINNKYLRYQMSTVPILNKINSLSKGSTFKEISLEELRKVEVLIPPLPEQTKIAQILSTWDKAIVTTEKLIGNSQQQKKALMQSLLTGKKRLPGFEGEWRKVQLGFCTKVIGGNAFKSEQFVESGVPILRISNIKANFTVNLDGCIYYDSIKISDKFKVISGDIVIAMSGATTGKVGRYYGNDECYLNQRVGKFIIDNSLAFPDFIFQLLKLSYVQSEILIDATGGAQPNISNSDIEKIKLSLPPLPEQQKIAQILTAADNEIELLQKKLVFLKKEKTALMQQLLTGKRRVKINATEECMDA